MVGPTRTIIAFVVSPPVGAILSLILMEGFGPQLLIAIPYAVVLSYCLAIFLGMPTYFLLMHYDWLTLKNITIVTFTASASPWVVLLIMNGQFTSGGIIGDILFLGMLGFCGSISGTVFLDTLFT